MSSVCQFCGQPNCPVGITSAGVLGGVFALLIQGYNKTAGFIERFFSKYKQLSQKRF